MPPSKKKTQQADPTFTLRILAVINKVRNQKQRPSIERVVAHLVHSYGLTESNVIKELNLSVKAGLVMKYIGSKGKESYRDPQFPNNIPSHNFVRKHSADLRMLVVMSIETLGSPNGSKISAVEEHIRSTHPLDLSQADLTSQLRLAVNHGVSDGLFLKNGQSIKIVPERAESLKQADNLALFAAGVEPSPVCGFCLGTSEYNKNKQPEPLLSCVDCGNSGHPSCLQFSPELTRQCMTEPWQCIECKVCSFCRDSGDASNLLFCDSCDKGFHMDCLQPPMKEMPKGFWACCLCERVVSERCRKRRRISLLPNDVSRSRTNSDMDPPESLKKILVSPGSTVEKKNKTCLWKSLEENGTVPAHRKTKQKTKSGEIKRKKKDSVFEFDDTDLMSDVKLINGIIRDTEKKEKKQVVRKKKVVTVEKDSEPADVPPKHSGVVAVITEQDRTLYADVITQTNKALNVSPSHKLDPSERSPKFIEFGRAKLETWYSSPFPCEYARLSKLYFCEYCLKYMKSKEVFTRHEDKCLLRNPPANEIYRHENISLFEVDGSKNRIYCQNLCLLAKMFLDHKTLYYDVEPFLFYVLTTNDELGCHLVGYFSKEKTSSQSYNLSCIMTLPHSQRKGYGKLLIDFSYLLSKKEGKPGTPEKPLSDLGLISYRSYWRDKVLECIAARTQDSVHPHEISKTTSILLEDVILALHDLALIQYDEESQGFYLEINDDLMTAYLLRMSLKKRHKINEDALLWSPIVRATYGISPERRKKKSSKHKSGEDVKCPHRMLLSPMKVLKSVKHLPEDSAPEEHQPQDIFIKHFPNWIPAGEDADRYRYTGDRKDNGGLETGEIQSFVMKKTPGRKKKVKCVVVYDPKTGKRFTRVLRTTKPSRRMLKSVKEKKEDDKDEDNEEGEDKNPVPEISSNEVSSTSDNVIVVKESTYSPADCEPHSTTGDKPELQSPLIDCGVVKGEAHTTTKSPPIKTEALSSPVKETFPLCVSSSPPSRKSPTSCTFPPSCTLPPSCNSPPYRKSPVSSNSPPSQSKIKMSPAPEETDDKKGVVRILDTSSPNIDMKEEIKIKEEEDMEVEQEKMSCDPSICSDPFSERSGTSNITPEKHSENTSTKSQTVSEDESSLSSEVSDTEEESDEDEDERSKVTLPKKQTDFLHDPIDQHSDDSQQGPSAFSAQRQSSEDSVTRFNKLDLFPPQHSPLRHVLDEDRLDLELRFGDEHHKPPSEEKHSSKWEDTSSDFMFLNNVQLFVKGSSNKLGQATSKISEPLNQSRNNNDSPDPFSLGDSKMFKSLSIKEEYMPLISSEDFREEGSSDFDPHHPLDR